MRRILTIAMLLGLAGCSGEGVGFGRLDVTPALQNACAGVAGGDPLIEADIHITEEARLEGYSRVCVLGRRNERRNHEPSGVGGFVGCYQISKP